MANLKKYNLQGEELGECTINSALTEATANSQLIKDYIVAIRNNLRQWSASTQGRSEVNHSNKKPHPQKGTGRARQGRLSSPQYKGGGVVFGPKPKFDQHTKINRKERRAALRSLIAEKVEENKIFVLDTGVMQAPKTKTIAQFVQGLQLHGTTLFLSEGVFSEIEVEGRKQVVSVQSKDHRNFALSIRNLPRAHHGLVQNLNGYDLCRAQNIVITEAGLKELTEWLAAPKKEEK